MERQSRAILLFLFLAIGFSVCYWITIILWPKGTLPSPVEFLLWAVFRGFGPLISAVIAASYQSGTGGIRILLSRLCRWKIEPRWYLIAFLWPVLAGISLLFAHFYSDMSLQPQAGFTPRLVFIFFAMAIADGPLGEEVGWRGFLLPELLKKWNPVMASLFIGLIWWAWHIPLYLADGKSIPWLPYLFDTVALSLIFTWFFLRTQQSTFFAILLHNISNYSIYLSVQCFPQVRGLMTGRIALLAMVVILGIAAAISMIRKSRLTDQTGFIPEPRTQR